MKVALILALLGASIAFSSAGRVVCHFFSWTVYRTGDGKFGAANVDPNLCTHILYDFIGLNETGHISILDDWDITGLKEIQHLVALKEKNPDLKILAAMGGWNEGSATYSAVAADADKRAILIADILSFLEENELDGFDLDWQYPGQRDGDPINDPDNVVILLSEIKEAFSAAGYVLSTTVPGQKASIDQSYNDAAALTDAVDFLNVMTYDYHGDWETWVGHNAPLHPSHLDQYDAQKQLNVAAGLQHWIDVGADPSKLNVGIGTYGRVFTLSDPDNTALYAPVEGAGDAGPLTDQAGVLGYNEICTYAADWEETWDDEQEVPHRVNGTQWVGFDDVKSIQLKIEYANSLGIGGAVVWSLDTDDFLGTCGDPFPLLTTINENLN